MTDIDIENIGNIDLDNIKSTDNKKKKKNLNQDNEEFNIKFVPIPLDPIDPNNPTSVNVYVKSQGCSHNFSDGENMAGILQAEGYNIVNDQPQAHVCIINSCTVKTPSENTFVNFCKGLEKMGKYVIVSGCVPEGDNRNEDIQGYSTVGVKQIEKVGEVVYQTILGNKVRLIGNRGLPSLTLPKIRKNKQIEIVPINSGCLGSCTQCKTKHARGNLQSQNILDITARIHQVIRQGVLEVWMTSEDTGAFGIDLNQSIVDLLRATLEVLTLQPAVMLKIGMTNPPQILEHLSEIAQVLNHPQVFAFLHIPVQSGSDEVLYKMNREYTIGEFEKVADYLSKSVRDITLATDFIVGFPQETDDDHQLSLDLIKKQKFNTINISKQQTRPNTPAAQWKQIDSKVKKNRSMSMTQLFESQNNNQKQIGTQQLILVTEFQNNQFVGHNKQYIKVVLDYDEINQDNIIGNQVIVSIESISKWHLQGKQIKTILFEDVNTNRLNQNKQNNNSIGLQCQLVFIVFVIQYYLFQFERIFINIE